MIETNKVTFRYTRQINWILKDFTFKAEPGEIISIRGKSGCGKTTLLNILNGVIPRMISGNFSGEVYFHDETLADLTIPEISPKISMLMPDPEVQLFFPD